MNGSPDELERRLRRLPRPPLSPELKNRVMAVSPMHATAISWRDRVWFSPAWRVAAAGAVVGILLLDHWSAGLTPPIPSGPDRFSRQAQADVTELATEVDVPPELVRRIAGQVTRMPLSVTRSRPGDVGGLFQ